MHSTELAWASLRRSKSIRCRNQVVMANRNLAYMVANRWVGQCPESIEDLAQIGMIGLVKAVDKFDHTQDVAFSSFAVPYIKGAILHHLRDHWGSVKIPRRAFEEAGKVKRIQRKMAAAGRVVSEAQAAAAAGISTERWAWISEAVQRKQLASLDDVLEVADQTADDSNREELNQALLTSVAGLPAKQRRVLTSKFFRNLSEEAIAKQERRSVAEVQAVVVVGLARLKSNLGETYAELM